MSRRNLAAERAPVLEVRGLDVETAAGRPLVRGLSLTLGCERVALIGRNGVGKSSLLSVLAGRERAARGEVATRGSALLVPQDLRPREVAETVAALQEAARRRESGADTVERELAGVGLPSLGCLAGGAELSTGEQRKLLLLHAKMARPDLLLLDEPSQDLDEAGCDWLRGWLGVWAGAALVVSHDRSLLRLFHGFVTIAEYGCRYVSGELDQVERELLDAEDAHRRDYVRRLNALEQKERHSEQFRTRRARKKNVGRIRELGRLTPRAAPPSPSPSPG